MNRSPVSIVIPCFNHSQYLLEAVASIERHQAGPVEVIIVNDGSTDAETLAAFETLAQRGYTVLHQPNQGPGPARNHGIARAKGPYILSFDSDNLLNEVYLTKAVDLLDAHPGIDIVYGDLQYFGERAGVEHVHDFELGAMVQYNLIDNCALYRKEVWEATGGYDGAMRHRGHEDWEFWLHAFLLGKKFHYLPEVAFLYRWIEGSMSRAHTDAIVADNRQYIWDKHYTHIIEVLLQHYLPLFVDMRYIREHKLKAFAKLTLGMPLVRK